MTLNRILALDALTCALMGVLLVLLAPMLAGLLGLPHDLLLYAGWLLFPIAAFMGVLAWQVAPPAAGVWLVVIGNVAWIVASLVVLVAAGPNFLGSVFLIVQAAVVAVLSLAEFAARSRQMADVAQRWPSCTRTTPPILPVQNR